MRNTIYRIPLEPHIFVGITFVQVAMALYQDQSIILIAVEVEVAGQIEVFLNPAEYIFQNKLHYGYVIANELPDTEKL